MYGEALLSDVDSRLYGRFGAVSIELLSAVNVPGFIWLLHKSTGSFGGGGDREFCAKFSVGN